MPIVTTPETLRPADAERLIESTRGRWFTATFVKRGDGSLRRMTCRTGVSAGVNGTGARYDAKARGLRVVWAADRLTYRSIALDAIVSIVHAGRRWVACPACGEAYDDASPTDAQGWKRAKGYCSYRCWGDDHGEGFDG